MATNNLPFSPAKVKIYCRVFKTTPKSYVTDMMLDILNADDEDISRRCAAIVMLWKHLPASFGDDHEAIYTFCETIAHVCKLARFSTRNPHALDEIRRIDAIRDEARDEANRLFWLDNEDECDMDTRYDDWKDAAAEHYFDCR